MAVSALIFDVDGTLADTEEVHRRSFNAAFGEFDLDWEWSPAQYRGLLAVAGGKERIGAWIDRLAPAPGERSRLNALVPQIHRRKTAIYTARVRDGEVPLRPGVARLIEEAHDAGRQLAIATTTTAANIDALLSATLGTSAIHRFAVVASADVVPQKKPSPAVYESVLRTLMLRPDDCVAFEDSRNGLLSAHGAGIPVVVTPTFWSAGDDLAAAELLLPHLGDAGTPLPDAAAATLGGRRWLGLADVDALPALRGAAAAPGANRFH